MSNKIFLFIYAGGLLHFLWGILHLFFPRIFKWKKLLSSTEDTNRNFLQTFNLTLSFCFFSLAYLSFFFTHELLTTLLGKKIIGIIGIFWILRFGLHFRFFKISNFISVLFLILIATTSITYIYPFIS